MIATPQHCEQQRLTFQARSTRAQCMMLATPYVAKWVGDHPRWKVTEWHCEWPEQRANPI
ncbi:hypothetical protein LQ948_12095 [Jiella sp. MQZ9-1]|nr:hypothetical protein [Jiella flava]